MIIEKAILEKFLKDETTLDECYELIEAAQKLGLKNAVEYMQSTLILTLKKI